MDRTSSVGWWIVWLIAAYLVTRFVSAAAGEPSSAGVPAIDQVFQRVAPSVVAIKARGRNPMSGGDGRFIERGSGVLISREGRVLTQEGRDSGAPVPSQRPSTALPLTLPAFY